MPQTPVRLRNWKSSSALATVALVAVCAVWGSTFVLVQDATARMPVMDFLAVRFAAAALVMLALRPGALRQTTRSGLWRGVALGAVLALGYMAQTYGLQYASAAVSGFITGMFVVLTPVMSWVLLRNRTGKYTWLAVALATLGLGLLSLHGWSVGTGELLTLACAVFFAVHIVGLGEWSPQHGAYSLALVQIATVAIISLGAAVPGGIDLPPDAGAWVAVGITAVLATAVAFLVQTWAQAIVSPTRAAVTMTMEPVFAGLFAVLLAGDRLTLRMIGGAACILAAMLMVTLAKNPRAARGAGTPVV